MEEGKAARPPGAHAIIGQLIGEQLGKLTLAPVSLIARHQGDTLEHRRLIGIGDSAKLAAIMQSADNTEDMCYQSRDNERPNGRKWCCSSWARCLHYIGPVGLFLELTAFSRKAVNCFGSAQLSSNEVNCCATYCPVSESESS